MKAAIMLDMLLRLQLIVPDGETLKLQSKALKTWLNRSVNEQHLVLYSIWKRLTLPAEAWLQHAVSLLERSDHGHWFSPLGLLTGLERQGLMPAPAESGLEERLGRLQQKWLDPLAAMGWLEKGTEALGGRYIIVGVLGYFKQAVLRRSLRNLGGLWCSRTSRSSCRRT